MTSQAEQNYFFEKQNYFLQEVNMFNVEIQLDLLLNLLAISFTQSTQ